MVHMCYIGSVIIVGLRELRQRASELVQRAEKGEVVTITVNGRPSVQMVAADRRTWRTFDEIAELFDGPPDPDWEEDRALLDSEVGEPPE